MPGTCRQPISAGWPRRPSCTGMMIDRGGGHHGEDHGSALPPSHRTAPRAAGSPAAEAEHEVAALLRLVPRGAAVVGAVGADAVEDQVLAVALQEKRLAGERVGRGAGEV